MADVGHLILLYFSVFTTSLSGEVIDLFINLGSVQDNRNKLVEFSSAYAFKYAAHCHG